MNIQLKERICLSCSEKMLVHDLRNKICISCKTKMCEVCKTVFTIKVGKNSQKTCSHNCTNIFKQRRKNIECDECGKVLIVNEANTSRRFCNTECYSLFARRHNWLNPPGKIKTLLCKVCDDEFQVPLWYNDKICCSDKCHKIWRKAHPTKPKTGKFVNCHRCENVVWRQPWQFNESDRYFCSNICVNKYKYEQLQAGFNVSKVELKFGKMLTDNNIEFTSQYKIPYNDGFRIFDFFIPSKNILVEIDGTYWHARDILPENLKSYHIGSIENDKVKNKLAFDLGFELIRIWEDEIDNFNLNLLI